MLPFVFHLGNSQYIIAQARIFMSILLACLKICLTLLNSAIPKTVQILNSVFLHVVVSTGRGRGETLLIFCGINTQCHIIQKMLDYLFLLSATKMYPCWFFVSFLHPRKPFDENSCFILQIQKYQNLFCLWKDEWLQKKQTLRANISDLKNKKLKQNPKLCFRNKDFVLLLPRNS